MESKKEGNRRQDQATERWHYRLLPLMRGGLVALAVFFFVASLVQYHLLYQDLRGGGPAIGKSIEELEKNLPVSQQTKLEFVRWKTLVLLEQEAMHLRYQQINATLLLRTWTRYTGFLVGMVLALVGAFFILGRLREETSQISIESSGVKGMLTSSSPGLILAVLGMILMVVTLAVKFDFTVNDRPVYLPLYVLSSESSIAGMKPPPVLPEKAELEPPKGPDDFPKPPEKGDP